MMGLACNHFMVLGKYVCTLHILREMLTLGKCEDKADEQKQAPVSNHSLPAEVKMTSKVSSALSHSNPTTMAPTSVKLEEKMAVLSSEGSNPLSTHSFYFPLLSNLP